MAQPTPPRPPLDAEMLATLTRSWRVEVVESTSSTNADVAARAMAGEAHGLVVVAERQTAGRGRLGRVWEAPARAGLTFSALVRPPVRPERWPWLPLLTGLAVVRALDSLGVTAVALKWPNDVLLRDSRVAGGIAKAGGILLERVETRSGPAAALGIGLNVSTTADELPVPTATSLLLAGHAIGRETLLESVLRELRDVYERWVAAPDDAALRDDYVAACATLGQRVEVSMPDGSSLAGTAVDVDRAGRLVVEEAGCRVPVGAGDVVHVRGQWSQGASSVPES
ncbi:MAG: biotin--[acetyl-CoA-carboxylase] ligase [Nocardioidaceae bacterium]